MDLTRKDIQLLVEKMFAGTISPDEQIILNTWIDEQVEKNYYVVDEKFATDERELRDRMLHTILAEISFDQQVRSSKFSTLKLTIAAASIIAVVGIAFLLLRTNSFDNSPQYTQRAETVNPDSIIAGDNNAVLVLENGNTIMLSADREGIIVQPDGLVYEDGKQLSTIEYEDLGSSNRLLTLSTPPGTTYKVTLPDGSVVWLNANSKISYPRVFDRSTREVSLVGEAFFDIVEDKNKPFKVSSNNQEIQVLGTRFNVYDYDANKESVVTLVDGLVKMRPKTKGKETAFTFLHPSEQAVVDGGVVKVQQVDVTPYIAWKNGLFYFNGASPKTALDQLAHWYDIEIVFPNDIPHIKFFGMIDRNKSLGSILRILEKSGMRFNVDKINERKRLIVFED